MRIDVITIFPDYLAPLGLSLLGKAQEQGRIDLRVHDLRSWTSDRHRTVDDTPYGGGPGMLMRPEPWGAALDSVAATGFPSASVAWASSDDCAPWQPDRTRPRLVLPSPAGRPFTQAVALEYAALPWLVFACGRYEGIDARVPVEAARTYDVDEVSLGDYVLNGGEVAVLVVVEAVARLLPGVIGNSASLEDESHAAGLLEAPAYTKPAMWRGHGVPEVLLSGDHARIARWKREQAMQRTAAVRPDLIARVEAMSSSEDSSSEESSSEDSSSEDRAVPGAAGRRTP